MPAEPPSQPDSKDRNRPIIPTDSGKEATEGDLWNLDDEPVERTAPRPRETPSAPRPAVADAPGAEAARRSVQRGKTPAHAEERKIPLAPAEPPPARDEIGELDEDHEHDEEEATLIVLPDDEQEAAAPASKQSESFDTAEEVEADSPVEAATPRQNRPRSEVQAPAAAAAATSLQLPKLKPRELIGIAAVAFVLLLGAIWVITRFFSQIPIQSPHAQAPNYPVKGSYTTVADAESYWRAPVREGANAEKIKREAMMIPVVEVSLDSASAQGALRLEFHNDKGEKVGDVITRGFQGGRFQANNEAMLVIPATDGFNSEAEFNAYLTSASPPWTVEIREGASIDGASASFKPLAIVPIKRARR